MNGKGFTLLIAAKAAPDSSAQQSAWQQAHALFAQALTQCADADRAMVAGNLGYASLLLGDEATGREMFAMALRLGGEPVYIATLDDLSQHPIAADAPVRAVLDQVWAQVRRRE